jgi:hypothetical protein
MIKTLALAAIALAASMVTAAAQSSSFYDARGHFAGSSINNRNGTSSFYDSRGHFAGSSIRHGNSTTSTTCAAATQGSSIGKC